MSRRPVIRLGDRTSGGGRVVQVRAQTFQVEGRPVATVGDVCTCSLPGHPSAPTIVEGDATQRIQGRPIALDGARLSCGCRVLASAERFAHKDL